MIKEKYTITGMTCSACSARVQKAAEKLPGQSKVAVNLLTNTMQIEYDEQQLTSAEIIRAVEQAGYGAALSGGQNEQAGNAKGKSAADSQEEILAKEAASMKSRLIWSVVFLVPLMYIAMHHMLLEWFGIPVADGFKAVFHGNENAVTFAFAQFLLACPILLLNRKYYINGFRNLLHGSPNMDSLVAMGSAASMVFGIFAIFRLSWGLGHGDWQLVESYSTNLYFESAGMIVTLITVGKYLEAKAKKSTGTALKKLMQLMPQTAVVLRQGQEQEIPAGDLIKGDEVIVRPGGAIPADGVILSGNGTLDEAAVTGESIPAQKAAGDTVISGSVNLDGYFHFRAEKVGSEAAINQIIQLVDEASSSKAPIAKMADKIAGVFVPAVITIAVIAGAGWLLAGESVEFAFSIAISILVISCPCALGLATPVAIMVGTGKGAEKGILIKSGEALEQAKHVDAVVLDKTGTVTQGKPQVTDVVVFQGSEQDFLTKLVSLEKASQHPLARAIVSYGESKSVAREMVEEFANEAGRGITGKVQGQRLFAGNEAYMAERGLELDFCREQLHTLSDAGKTVLLLADEQALLGMIAAADMEKADSAAAVAELQKQGIEVIMLTGDNERTAKAVAQRVGISQVKAQVLPQDKDSVVRELQGQGHVVAMAGDGINDAPALARADVGIAVGAGTDIALDSADVVLVGNSLLDVSNTISLSRAVIRNIKENLFWAFFYNIVCIPLAAGLFYPAFGIKLSPMIGAAAMSMSSVCVVLNALRLKGFSFKHNQIQDKAAGTPVAEKATMQQETVQELCSACGEKTSRKDEVIMTTELKIEGMMCAHCQKHVQEALSKMDGVTSVAVNLEKKTATVETAKEISWDEFNKVIKDAGYELL